MAITKLTQDSIRGNSAQDITLMEKVNECAGVCNNLTGDGTAGPGMFTNVEIDGALNHDGSTVGFYGTTPIAQQTGVAVDAASIHAALVALGLITA